MFLIVDDDTFDYIYKLIYVKTYNLSLYKIFLFFLFISFNESFYHFRHILLLIHRLWLWRRDAILSFHRVDHHTVHSINNKKYLTIIFDSEYLIIIYFYIKFLVRYISKHEILIKVNFKEAQIYIAISRQFLKEHLQNGRAFLYFRIAFVNAFHISQWVLIEQIATQQLT